MGFPNEIVNTCNRRILLSRMRLLSKNGFFGLLLMHVRFALNEEVRTAGTDGTFIMFNPAFMQKLSDEELDFILMHEVMHMALRHCTRNRDKDQVLFNIACDIVVNSNILYANGMKTESITLREYGESMHRTPNDDEGYRYTAEQVYDMLLQNKKRPSLNLNMNIGQGKKSQKRGNTPGDSSMGKGPGKESGKEPGKGNKNNANMKSTGGSGQGQGKSGQGQAESEKGSGNQSDKQSEEKGFDNHTLWTKSGASESAVQDAVWAKRIMSAASAMESRRGSKGYGWGDIPAIQRQLKELTNPQTDWRRILNEFVQEEITDYSFTPPDKRFAEGDFFLPDFNEKDEYVKNILFMIDCSGSVSDKMMTVAFSEVKGALDQYDGRLSGYLGFFDTKVKEPEPFEDVEELLAIKPAGGGGTRFDVIFTYVKNNMEEPPAMIIVLTDGYAKYPEESIAAGIPVLWMINNEKNTPPWGKVARIDPKKMRDK